MKKMHLFFKQLQMKKVHLLTLIALIILGLSGCEKAKVTNVALADTFVKAIKNEQGVTVYAAVHSAFSYNVMKSVSVTTPGGTTIQLPNFENGGLSFFNEPVLADYSTTGPAAGVYTYLVTFNDGEEITYTNTLATSTLLPANITSLAKSANGDSVYIYWDAIATTHAYQLKVMNGTKEVFFQTPFVDAGLPLKANLRYGFRLSDLTKSDGSGTYDFELTGLLYESTAYDYIQAISTSIQSIEL